MQRLTCVVLPPTAGRDRASRAHSQLAISIVHYPRSQTNDRDIWSGNENTCAHAYTANFLQAVTSLCTIRYRSVDYGIETGI